MAPIEGLLTRLLSYYRQDGKSSVVPMTCMENTNLTSSTGTACHFALCRGRVVGEFPFSDYNMLDPLYQIAYTTMIHI